LEDNLLENIKKYLKVKTAVVGIGNTFKGDDGVGPLLISRLKGKTEFFLFDCGEVPENYVQPIIESAPETVIIVDASDWGGRPGEIRLIEKDEIKNFGFSTHNASLRLFFEYLQKQLPSVNIFIIGVQTGIRQLMQPLSPEVDIALNNLVGFFTEL